jgi:hypothetical protein
MITAKRRWSLMRNAMAWRVCARQTRQTHKKKAAPEGTAFPNLQGRSA